MVKMRCADPPFCCGKEWDAPDPVACPRCDKIDDVRPWEAWGHPNGELVCYECCGYNSCEPLADGQYFTFNFVDSEYVIHEWNHVE